MKGISAARQENDGSEKAQKKSLKLHGEFVNGRPWGRSKECVHNDTQIDVYRDGLNVYRSGRLRSFEEKCFYLQSKLVIRHQTWGRFNRLEILMPMAW